MDSSHYIQELKAKSIHFKNVSELCNDYSSDSEYLMITKSLKIIMNNKFYSLVEKAKPQSKEVNLPKEEIFEKAKPRLITSLSSYRDNLQVFICKLSWLTS
jgi:hypothetical protein